MKILFCDDGHTVVIGGSLSFWFQSLRLIETWTADQVLPIVWFFGTRANRTAVILKLLR